jgi:hypothetical protein
MKRMGDVHPMITVLGVIVGLNLFGFIGLIFGPLLVSYFMVSWLKFISMSLADSEDMVPVSDSTDSKDELKIINLSIQCLNINFVFQSKTYQL